MPELIRDRVYHRVLDWTVVLLLPLLFISTSVRIEMNSPALYTRGFELYEVADTTDLDEEQLEHIVIRLIDYFNSLAATPQMQVTKTDGTVFPLYHDYELIHLDDVKGLFDVNSLLQSAIMLLVVVLAALAVFQHRLHALLLVLRNGAVLALGGLVVGAVLFAADFGGMFVEFHLLLFDNPFWQLDPRTDYLVMLFPYQFWQDMFMIAGGMTAVFSLITLGASRHSRPRMEQHSAASPDV